jgi:class 3 adenylate cyclase/tetratricopeptide (TPR) repeat protein
MLCTRCGSDNEPGRKFCGECGHALALVCSSCGTLNSPGLKFCGECGSALVPEGRPQLVTIPTPAAAASSDERLTERRHVSVLFADLVGFTTLSEARDPEEVRDLLSQYFEVCRRLIVRYGGVVEKFIGDAVMAVWGTPVAREDDAERAVRAALDLTEAVTALGREAGFPELRARAGVLTGEAAVAIGADGQGMVAGDLVNTASRIQAAAAPGSVLVGDSTRSATEAAVAYEDVGLHELKGKAEPLQLWRATRVVGLLGGSVKQSALEPPFVGRDRELHLIKELFHASAEERRANLVSVVGIGGIGKSRLSWEFEKYVDGLVEPVLWHRGRCLAYGDGVAFWALADMVRMRAGISEDEDAASARTKLHATVETHIADFDERRFVEPRLSHLLGLEDRGSGDQENLLSAWRLFFERLSETSPTVMVFEDIHWADSALLDFIEYLLAWSKGHAIFVMTLARPELADRRPTWGAGKRNFTSLFLEPLPAEAMSALLRAPVPGLPDELQTQILARAEGVPFYAVETVRMLLDRGLIVREGSAYHPVGAIDTLEIPETLQALIAARLDGLEPAERQLLQDAAVLGRTFTVAGIRALTGLSETDLEPILAALVRKEVLSRSMDALSPERGQYGFLQDLVKKVAYDTMSRRRRRTLHVAAAEFLEAGSGAEEDEAIEVIAAHYLDAYRAAPDDVDAPALRDKARDRLIRAAGRASSLGANLEAQRAYERAAELADDSIARAELLESAGMMAVAGDRGDDALRHFEQSIALFESQGSLHPAARVTARLGEALWNRGRLMDSLEMTDRAFEVLATDEPDEDLAWLATELGRFQFFAGNLQAAALRLETALDIAEAIGLPEVISQALNTKSLILGARGRTQEASALLRHALQIALDNDRPSAALRAYNNLVDRETGSDRYEAAQKSVESGLALARRMGDRRWERTFLGYCYPLYCLGRWDEALALMDELDVEDRDSARIAFGQGYVAFGTAIRVQRGQMDEARTLMAMFADHATSSDTQERTEYFCAEATLSLAEGKAAQAVAAARRGIETLDLLGVDHHAVKESLVLAMEAALSGDDLTTADEVLGLIEGLPSARRPRFLDAQVLRMKARLADRRGDAAAPDQGFTAAASAFREMSLPFWVAVTLLEHCEWLNSQQRPGDLRPLRAEAGEIFERLRAAPWLRRLAAVVREPNVASLDQALLPAAANQGN